MLTEALLLVLAFPRLWIVDAANGPGSDFSNIQAAVDAAASGDTILVREGQYGAVVIDGKGLVLHAANPTANVAIQVDGTGIALTIKNVPAGKRCTVRGFDVRDCNVFGLQQLATVQLESNTGVVWFEDVSIQGSLCGDGFAAPGGWYGLLVDSTAMLVLTRTTSKGGRSPDPDAIRGGSGLHATGSNIRIFHSEFRGADSYCTFGGAVQGGHGAELVGSNLFAVDATFVGADNDPGCFGSGGHGLVLEGDLRAVASIFQGGMGAMGGADGEPVKIVDGAFDPIPAKSVRFEAPAPVDPGSPVRLGVRGGPGDLAFLVLSAVPRYVPGLRWVDRRWSRSAVSRPPAPARWMGSSPPGSE